MAVKIHSNNPLSPPLFSSDNPIPADGTNKVPPPFSMSGDGVQDVEIVSVFMKHQDAQFLISTWQERGEVALSLLPDLEAARKKYEQKSSTESEQKSSTEHEEELSTENEQKLTSGFDAVDFGRLNKEQMDFIETINSDTLQGDLKESVEKFISEEVEKMREQKVSNLKRDVEKFIAEKLDQLSLQSAGSAATREGGEVCGDRSSPLSEDGGG